MKENDNTYYLEELINKSIKKSESSFCSLIHIIEPEMYKIAKLKLKKEEDIYEAIQETIILIYKNLRKLKNKAFFRTWAIRILLNECTKIYNKNKKYKENCIEYDENLNIQYDGFEKIESERNMDKLLSCLNESEKIIIILYYADSFTTIEIANIVSKPEGTIKSQISRAKTKIKKMIEEKNLYE